MVVSSQLNVPAGFISEEGKGKLDGSWSRSGHSYELSGIGPRHLVCDPLLY
jgi:hypothetical protein